MTNEPAELTGEQLRQLTDCYHTLRSLADSCRVPSVNAAVGMALAELRVALDAQDAGIAYFAR